MNTTSPAMTPQEVKVRYFWLISTISLTCFPLLLFSLIVYVLTIVYGEDSSTALLGTVAISTICAILTYILIHCAYRKFGTAYLTFCLVLGPIYFLKATLGTWTSLSDLIAEGLPAPFVLVLTSCFLMNIFLYLFWFVMSCKLRKVNREILRRKIHSCNTYQEAVAKLTNATCINDLNQKFSNIVKRPHENGFVDALHEEYKKQKSLLEPA